MTLIYAVLSTLALAHGPGTDSLAAGRRIAASVQLAAQEYRNGFAAGKITSPAEVNEARLFLAEARRSAQVLPARIVSGTIADIDLVLDMLARTALPDSVAAGARRATDHLATALGAPLDEIPDRTPSLQRGAEIFRRECSVCHGASGHGDGVGRPGAESAACGPDCCARPRARHAAGVLPASHDRCRRDCDAGVRNAAAARRSLGGGAVRIHAATSCPGGRYSGGITGVPDGRGDDGLRRDRGARSGGYVVASRRGSRVPTKPGRAARQ